MLPESNKVAKIGFYPFCFGEDIKRGWDAATILRTLYHETRMQYRFFNVLFILCDELRDVTLCSVVLIQNTRKMYKRYIIIKTI